MTYNVCFFFQIPQDQFINHVKWYETSLLSVGRMRTPVREAFSYLIRHVIRHVHCDSMSYDQIRVKPYPVSYRVWRMILGRMHELKCKKISCKLLQKSDWSYGNGKTNVSHKLHSVYLIKTVNKRGERSSQIYDNSNVSPYGSCCHSFCMRSSGVWNWGCVLPNWWRYGVWYVVVGYEWMIRIVPCRINHTLVQGLCRSYKVESNKWFFISFIFCNKSYMFTKGKINDK